MAMETPDLETPVELKSGEIVKPNGEKARIASAEEIAANQELNAVAEASQKAATTAKKEEILGDKDTKNENFDIEPKEVQVNLYHYDSNEMHIEGVRQLWTQRVPQGLFVGVNKDNLVFDRNNFINSDGAYLVRDSWYNDNKPESDSKIRVQKNGGERQGLWNGVNNFGKKIGLWK